MLRRQLAFLHSADLIFGTATPDEVDGIVATVRSLMGDSVLGRINEIHLIAIAHAYRNEVEDFDESVAEFDRIWRDLGDPAQRYIYGQGQAEALRWLGRLGDAETQLLKIKERLDARHETSFNATITALLALVACEQGRDDDAARLVREARSMTSEDDFAAQAQCRWTESWLAAKDGRHDEAFSTIDEALGVIADSDYLNMHADTHRYRGEVLRLAGDERAAQAAFAEAFALWERKGNVAAARTLRETLA